MRTTNFYKPSNKFSVIGFILLFLSVTVAGIGLSWIYLILNAVIPWIYACIFFAFCLSFALGTIGAFFVKTYKMRNPAMAVLAVVLALLIVNYAKWAIYVNRDFEKNYYKDMKAEKASEYYSISLKDVEENFDSVDDFITSFKAIKASDFAAAIPDSVKSQFSAEERERLSTGNVWDLYELDEVLGTSTKEVTASLNKIDTMNAYDYSYKYRNMHAATVMRLMTHPSELWQDIKDINEVGRWSIGRRLSTSKSLVNGVMLWLVWIAELAVLVIPAIDMVYKKASHPFIEEEDDWAVEEKMNGIFRFRDPYPNSLTKSPNAVKTQLLQTPDFMLMQSPLSADSSSDRYYSVNYCHSKYYDYNYITVSVTATTYNRNKHQETTNVLLSNIAVDPDYIASLYAMFGIALPPMCKGVDRRGEMEQVIQPDNVKSSGYEDIFDKPIEVPKERHHAQPTAPQPAWQAVSTVEEVQMPQSQTTESSSSFPNPAQTTYTQEYPSSYTPPEPEKPRRTLKRPGSGSSSFIEKQLKEEKKTELVGEMDSIDTSHLVIDRTPSQPTPPPKIGSATSGDMDGLDTSNLDLSNLK